MSRVSTNFENHIATVTLQRPEKMNAMDPAMFTALAEAGAALMGRKDLRVVVLQGAGESFCAGIDTSSFAHMIQRIDQIKREMLELPEGELANPFQKTCTVWQDLEVPVIAALQGSVFGAGAQLALAADFRIAGPDLKFSIMESKWGLIPDMGLSQSLPKLLRADQAKELMMTARVLEAAAALEIGLVTRLADDPQAAAQMFAKDLAARSPEALRGCKRLVEQSWNASRGDGLRLEAELQAGIIASPNQIEAVMAVVQKRTPKFE